MLKYLLKIFSDSSADGGRILVEIYLNYDCDVEATERENIWERLINSLGKVMTLHQAVDSNLKDILTVHTGVVGQGGLPPGLTTATLTNFTKEQVKELYSATGDYNELKKRGLELLVKGILKPLVEWCVSKTNVSPLLGMDAELKEISPLTSPEKEKESLGLIQDSDEYKKQKNAIIPNADDPTQFQTLKFRKQALLEGVSRFNSKAKKVIQLELT